MEFISTPVGGHKTPIKVLSKQYKARHRRRIVTGILAALAIGSVAMSYVYVVVTDPAPRRTSTAARSSAGNAGADGVVRTESVTPLVRPIYRHSVVPGGVRSREELADVIQHDQVVAAHYKGIDPQLMRHERLQAPLLAHVSYRLGDKIYWTKKPVQLPKYEAIMTDGTTSIRERCGNVISMDPLAPVSDEEPPLPSLDLLIDPMQFAWQRLDYTPPGLRSLKTAPAPGTARALPSFIAPPGSPFLRSQETPSESPAAQSIDDPPTEEVTAIDAPVPVPEPGTLTLFGLGGAAGLANYLRKRAKARARS